MLAILPPQTAFFKLQVRDDKLGETLDPMMRSELDLSFSKIERLIMDYIAASSDRVVVHQALKHLIVSGNALIFMGKDGLKHYPLNRYVVERDGNGNVIEIITKELVSRKVLGIVPLLTSSQLANMVLKKTTLRYTPVLRWMRVVVAGDGIKKWME